MFFILMMDTEHPLYEQLKAQLHYEMDLGIPDLPRTHSSGDQDLMTAGIPEASSPITAGSSPTTLLKQIEEDIGDCKRCKLCEGRTNIVFGVGNPNADLMFIGEGPGYDEDKQGEPFVGRAGQLLNRMIQAMGLQRSDVYIANIVKCRPPKNRNPEADEIETCYPFLLRQIQAVQPKVIVGLGNIAVQTLLSTRMGIMRLRGQFQEINGIPFMPTFHPAFLLRNPEKKKEAWEDLQQVMTKLGLELPKKS